MGSGHMDDGPAQKSSAEPTGLTRRRLEDECRNRPRSYVSLLMAFARSIQHAVDREANLMTTDLWYLAFTAMLTAALWIPYIACQVMTNGPLSGENYVDPAPRPVPLWGQRAHRAYLNAIECFAPFAALVIVAHIAGKANAMTAFWAMSFFWLRLAHAAVYWAAVPYLRTVLFTLGFVCVAGIFWEVIR
jgi:uncharacterized MAPEG superfamily protein